MKKDLSRVVAIYKMTNAELAEALGRRALPHRTLAREFAQQDLFAKEGYTRDEQIAGLNLLVEVMK